MLPAWPSAIHLNDRIGCTELICGMASKARNGTSDGVVKSLAAVGAAALLLYGSKTLINFFGPQPRFAINHDLTGGLDSEEFIQFLSVITDAARRHSKLRRLKNGIEFYPEELDAIRRAKHAVNLEYFEFLPGKIADQMLAALTERARAGVEVRLMVDAVGSLRTSNRYFDPLRAAGGQMCWYHPLRWNTWPSMNQRSHRKLLVVDGETGFIGGAGIADHWLQPTHNKPTWRDTVFCVEGEAVAGLISTFCENWLEASGEILSGDKQFGFRAMPNGSESFVVPSTPRGGGTQARILFQALIKSARKTIKITTPYFLPDRSARRALEEAVQRRGVKVQILTAGPRIDHPFIRTLSRHGSRHLLLAGAEIFEYQPSMIHAKLMTVDGQWTVMGSTNFDHRSFALNDEVNLAVLDRELAAVIETDFAEDITQSRPLTLDMLHERSVLGKLEGVLEDPLRSES
jgi:cardiolipin synthase